MLAFEITLYFTGDALFAYHFARVNHRDINIGESDCDAY